MPLKFNLFIFWACKWDIVPLRGLGNIIQIRKNGAKVVTSMLDVQLKIIWKFEWKQTIINHNNWEKLIWSDRFINSPNYIITI